MSVALEARVLAAHPLAPAHRMVLFWIAREVPEGRTEVLVNRTGVARALDAGAQVVQGALAAGRAIGLCHVLQNGRIAFTGYDGLLGSDPAAPETPGRPAVVIPQDDPKAEVARQITTKAMVFAAFGTRWTERYKQRFVISGERDYPRLAGALCVLSPDELDARLDCYFADPDPYWADCKHSFGSFARNVHRFVPTTTAAAKQARVKDADATRDYLRKQREGRA